MSLKDEKDGVKSEDIGISVAPLQNNGTLIEVQTETEPTSVTTRKDSNAASSLEYTATTEDGVIVDMAAVGQTAESVRSGGGHTTLPPSSSFMYVTSLGILKFAGWIAPRNVDMMRAVTDHSIPSFLLPSGVHLQKRVIMIPSCEMHPDLTGEVYTHSSTEKRIAESAAVITKEGEEKMSPKTKSSSCNMTTTTTLSTSSASSTTTVSSSTTSTSPQAASEPETTAIAESSTVSTTPTRSSTAAAEEGTEPMRVIKPEQRLKRHFGITVLYAHGGAYCLCSTKTHRRLLALLCLKSTARIVAVNYRRPPEVPHSCCMLDIIRAYLELIASGTPPESIILAGDSAGGGLCVSTLLALRDAKRPLPAGAALMSPWVDLSEFTGGSWGLNHKTDFLAQDLAELFAKAVIGETGDSKDPSISPVYADLHGLPPLCIEAGGSEVLLSQISRFVGEATLAGVEVEFKASPGMVHVFQLFDGMGLKEPGDSLDRIADFIKRKAVISIGSPYGFTIKNSANGLKSLPKPKPLGKLARGSSGVVSGGEVKKTGKDDSLPPPLSHYD